VDDTRLVTMGEKAEAIVKLLKQVQAIAEDEIRCPIDDMTNEGGLSIRERTELVAMRTHANKIIGAAQKLYTPGGSDVA
jgi:hypothetical protein